jgi:hypothetical protein
MANPKWVKWVVGISSVALFTGMVGVFNHSETTSAASPASSDIINSSPTDESIQDGSSSDSFQQRPLGGRGRGSSSESTDEGMRTHAS